MNNCWICGTTDERTGGVQFDMEFDTFVHTKCLEDAGVDSVLEYERQNEGNHSVKYRSVGGDSDE